MNRRLLFPGLVLVVMSVLVFAPSIRFDFVNWDDPAYIHFNESIKSWAPSSLWGVATETVTRNYAPLTIFSFLIDYTITGMNPSGYHATNVLLHTVNGLLVMILIRQLTGSLFVGWVTAALFLVHPVQIETVAWISSRKGLLSATLMLAAVIVRMRPDAQLKHDGWYLLLLGGALLSKALAVVLPPMILLYDRLVRRESTADSVVRQILPGMMSLLLLLYTINAQTSVLGGVRSHMELPLLQILAVDVTILWQYIGMLAWPHNLCVLYDPPTEGIHIAAFAGTVAWCLVAAAAFQIRRKQPLWLFSLVCFLLLLFPVLNFFRITTLMNDRYLYLPCVCVFAPAAAALRWVTDHVSQSAVTWARGAGMLIRGAAVTGALAACMVMTGQHLPVWRNAETLWTHALERAPQLAVVRIQWALTLYDSGRVREAIAVLEQARQQCELDEADARRVERHLLDWNTELSQLASATHPL